MDEIIDIDTMFGPLPSGASDLSVDELQTMMQRHDVRACCTLSTVGLLLDHSAGNAATKAACAESPKLLPVATVNPQTFFGADGPYARFAADGFKMVRFFPGHQSWDSDVAPFVALAKALEVEKLPIMVDIDRSGTATRLLAAIPNHPAPVVLSGVSPSTSAEAVALMRKHANVYLCTSDLLATGVLKYVVDAIGADRVVYGSGAPLRPMASSLGVLRHAGLSDDQRAQILGANSRKLFGL
jgi:predicted TIM-barrel fold metal-dependent hydrolase